MPKNLRPVLHRAEVLFFEIIARRIHHRAQLITCLSILGPILPEPSFCLPTLPTAGRRRLAAEIAVALLGQVGDG